MSSMASNSQCYKLYTNDQKYMRIFIQGDLVIRQIDQLPKGLKKKADNILVRGESTGHSHRLIEGEVYGDELHPYLQTFNQTQIIHEEHLPIELPAGNWEVVRQREYTNEDAQTLVID